MGLDLMKMVASTKSACGGLKDFRLSGVDPFASNWTLKNYAVLAKQCEHGDYKASFQGATKEPAIALVTNQRLDTAKAEAQYDAGHKAIIADNNALKALNTSRTALEGSRTRALKEANIRKLDKDSYAANATKIEASLASLQNLTTIDEGVLVAMQANETASLAIQASHTKSLARLKIAQKEYETELKTNEAALKKALAHQKAMTAQRLTEIDTYLKLEMEMEKLNKKRTADVAKIKAAQGDLTMRLTRHMSEEKELLSFKPEIVVLHNLLPE